MSLLDVILSVFSLATFICLVSYVVFGVVWGDVGRVVGQGWNIIKGGFHFFKSLWIEFWMNNVFLPTIVSIYYVNIDQEMVNPERAGFRYTHCPHVITVKKRLDGRLWVDFGDPIFETVRWYKYPCVTFRVGSSSGFIKTAIIDYKVIHTKGKFFCHTCANPEWTKYMSSVVQAHIEVLKFGMSRRSRYPQLTGRIFKHYGDSIFQGI
jgi:hypothetical protein